MILAFDLGTGGAKVCLYGNDGFLVSKDFSQYPTEYRGKEFHIQNPENWWNAVVSGTRKLIAEDDSIRNQIESISISGQSLTVIPMDKHGRIIFTDIPIWSDTRPAEQTRQFFNKVDKDTWYTCTGNGFTPECYSLFKIMWYRDNYPDKFKEIDFILGSKDYINFRLTGNIATDYSYASGSGAYNLNKRNYIDEYFSAAEIPAGLLPVPVRSDEYLGTLTENAASQLSISSRVKVYCGGVDNSCMALGAGNTAEGKVYLSLGSSAWIAVSSEKPLIDTDIRPFIFDHVVPGMYTSATSIFSAGSSLNWFKNTIAGRFADKAKAENRDVFELLIAEAEKSSIGSNGVIFNPTMAGSPEASAYSNIAGAFLNLNLNSSFNDLARAVLEGICFDLYGMYMKLNKLCALSDNIVIVGGGSRSVFWTQLFSDIFKRKFTRISTDQDAAALGAAAIAAVGSGFWKDYSQIDVVIQELEIRKPVQRNSDSYSGLFERYEKTKKMLSDIGCKLNG